MRIGLRLLSILFLSFFVFTTVGEAKGTSVSRRPVSATKSQIKTQRHQKRTPPGLLAKKKQTVSKFKKIKLKKIQQTGKLNSVRKLQTKKPQKQKTKIVSKKARDITISKKKNTTQNKRPKQKLINKSHAIVLKKSSSTLNFNTRNQKIIPTKENQSKIIPKKSSFQNQKHLQSKLHSTKPLNYFSQLNHHTQRNARVGKLDQLFSKNHLGQGQTVGIIELSGTWDELQDIMNGKEGNLPHSIRENYKRNFLSPIGDPRVDPSAKNDKNYSKSLHSDDDRHHGSRVASVLLDLAPRAKVLPVSTYKATAGESYDVADALMMLSKRPDVGVINISSGQFDYDVKLDFDKDNKLISTYSFSPKHIEAFKTVVKAGKVVVLAAGNGGIELQNANTSIYNPIEKYRLHLLENLDVETRKSIIFAGNIDPALGSLYKTSSRPGTLTNARDIFLCAPGEVEITYGYKGYHFYGTSHSAPYISATIANLCSRSPQITPKQAVKALLETADKQSDVKTYGRGIINASRALELLEKEILK